eukprot:Rmarinus@m.22392
MDAAAVRERLQCPLCESVYNEENRIPRAFPCMHTFCQACLVKWFASSKNDMSCPVCRRVAKVNDAKDLEKNYPVIDLARVLKRAHVGKEVADVPVLCSLCPLEDESPAESFCGACNIIMCKPHVELHKHSRLKASHVLVDVSAVPPAEMNRVLNSAERNVLMCSMHIDEKLRYYCQDCDEVICLDCYNIRHKPHAVQEIDVSLADSRKQRLDHMSALLLDSFRTGNENSGPLQTYDVDHCAKIITSTAKEVIQQIESQRNLLNCLIKEEVGADVKAFKQQQVHRTNLRATAESLVLYWKSVRERLSPAEALVAYPGLLSQMEQLLGQPSTVRLGRPLVSLVLPALQPFGHTTSSRNKRFEKRLKSVSTSVPIPEGKGSALALSYDSYRDALWIITSERWIGCFLVGHRRWMDEGYYLDTSASNDAEKGILDFVVMGNGLCFVIPTSQSSVEVYDHRGKMRALSLPAFSEGSKLCGLACSGTDLFVNCDDSSVYVVSLKDHLNASVALVCQGTELGGRLCRTQVFENGLFLAATVRKEDSVDVLSIVVPNEPDGYDSCGAIQVIKTIPGKHEGAVACDDDLIACWSNQDVALHSDQDCTSITMPDPIIGITQNTRREVFVLSEHHLTVFDNSVVSLPPFPVNGCKLSARPHQGPSRTIRSLCFDMAGSLWMVTDSGDVIEYHCDLMIERFCCNSFFSGSNELKWHLKMTEEGDIVVYATGKDKVLRYNPEGHSVTEENLAFPKESSLTAYATSDFIGWYIEGETVVHVGTTEHVVGSPVTFLGASSDGNCILVGGECWILVVRRGPDSSPVKFKIPSTGGHVVSMTLDTGKLVVATKSGMLWLLDAVSGTLLAGAPARMPDIRSVALHGAAGLLAVGGESQVRFFRLDDWFLENSNRDVDERCFIHDHFQACETCREKKELFTKEDLFSAVQNGLFDCVLFVSILSRGAFASEKTGEGDNVLHLAAKGGHSEMIQFFNENCAADLLGSKNEAGETPREVASRAGKDNVIHLLGSPSSEKVEE